MAQTNVQRRKSGLYVPTQTHEGGPAIPSTPQMELRRAICSCLLWEDTFYESGVSIADRIADCVNKVVQKKDGVEEVEQLAIHARTNLNIRHAPLLLVRELARLGVLKARLVETICQRADEPAELLSLYWSTNNGKRTIAAQLKKGLRLAYRKFDKYQLAKYKGEGKAVTMRDVMFMAHAKPVNDTQAEVFKSICEREAKQHGTWEDQQSAGKEKKTDEQKRAVWEKMLAEGKLGAMALVRNLRNMLQCNVDIDAVKQAIRDVKATRMFPYRFIAAEKHAPAFTQELEGLMLRSCQEFPKLQGKTAILVDCSASMTSCGLSAKSEMTPQDAACALAILAREVCKDCRVLAFGASVAEVPARRGFALRDAIRAARVGHATFIGLANTTVAAWEPDRTIVITDGQAHDTVGPPHRRGYMLNVASYKNGVGFGDWARIDGWSDAILRFIAEIENIAG